MSTVTSGQGRLLSFPGSQVLAISIIIMVGYLAGKAVVNSSDFILLMFYGMIFVVGILRSEKNGIALTLLLSFYFSHVADMLAVPGVYGNLVRLLVLLLFLRMVISPVLHEGSLRKTPINNGIFLLFLFIMVSYVLNQPPIGPAFKGLIRHALFILFFLVVANSKLRASEIKKAIMAIMVVAFVQAPASMIQYFVMYAGVKSSGFRADNSAGLLGYSSGDVNAVLATFVFSIIVGFIMSNGVKIRYVLAIPILLIPLVLSSARAGLVFFVVTGLFVLVSMFLMRVGVGTARVVSVSCLMIVMVIGIVVMAPEDQVGFVTNPSDVYEYSIRGGESGLGRFQSVEFVHNNIGDRAMSAVFGLGPGSITPTREEYLGGSRIKLYKKHKDLLSHYQSYAYVTLELGYGGLLLFLYLYYKLFTMNGRFLRNVEDKFWKAVSIGFFGIIFTSVYSTLYTVSWIEPALVVPFWFIAGGIYRVGYLKGIFENPSSQGRAIGSLRLPTPVAVRSERV